MNRSPGDTGLWKELLTGRDDLSWAGASAGDRGYCFGTEDGTVFWTNFDGVQYGKPLVNAAIDDYEEAINGVAFNAGRMVVTTRSGSAIWNNADGKKSGRTGGRIGEGSHGVVAGERGIFFMPLNVGGLMSVYEDLPSHFSTFVSNSQAMDLNVYRAASLVATDGRQVVALVARRGGMAMGYYKLGEVLDLTTIELPGADFIDICQGGYSGYPSAAYAITRDSHILAFGDIMSGDRPVTLRYERIVGTAYRILSAGEFVFVLTSRALHVIHNLTAHSTGSFRVNRTTQNKSFPLEAIDINLVGQRWLLVLLADRVLRMDLHELAKDLASDFEEKVSEPTDVWADAIFKGHKLDSHKSDLVLVK